MGDEINNDRFKYISFHKLPAVAIYKVGQKVSCSLQTFVHI